MKKLLAAALLAALPTLAAAVPYVPRPAYLGMHQTYSASITDYLYTTNLAESNASLSSGYADPTRAFFVEQYPLAQTIALHRYWKGAPSTEHVYITPDQYPQDLANVNNAGYTYEGIAGYLYPKSLIESQPQLAGAVLPLYRLAKFNGSNNDLQHKFTTAESEKNLLIGQGWTFDHIEGYVPNWTINSQFIAGYPSFPGGHIMTRRCGPVPTCPGDASFRNGYNGYKFVNATTKPVGKTTQVMTFDLWTPDYFSASQTDHIAIGLHGHWNINLGDVDNRSIPAHNHHALGIIIGATGCGTRAMNVRVEAFWPTGNNVSACSSNNQSHVLNNNQRYRFRISVGDNGYIHYTVNTVNQNGSVGMQVASDVVNGNTLYGGGYGFPSADTGYFMVQATMDRADYTVYFSNLNVAWE